MLKRTFDIVVSGLVVVLALPLWLFISLSIKVDSRGPVFYRSRRIGRGGQPYMMVKFRTMVTDAERRGPNLTKRDDPRMTRVGRFLRHYKIDEMPQLLNVLVGSMSIVGPRPEDDRHVAAYTPDQRRLLTVKPGMANAAFLVYRHEEVYLAGADDVERLYDEVVLPDKIRMDLDYVDRRSFALDMKILFASAVSLFRPPPPSPIPGLLERGAQPPGPLRSPEPPEASPS